MLSWGCQQPEPCISTCGSLWLADCKPPVAAGVDHAFVSVGGWIEEGAPAWSMRLVVYIHICSCLALRGGRLHRCHLDGWPAQVMQCCTDSQHSWPSPLVSQAAAGDVQ